MFFVSQFWFKALLKFSGMAYLLDRKSTRLNSSHVRISYAVFCLKKKISVSGIVAPSSSNDVTCPAQIVHLVHLRALELLHVCAHSGRGVRALLRHLIDAFPRHQV